VHATAVRLGVDMPLTAGVNAVLAGQISASEGVAQLLRRDAKAEHA
jgi:glycerol-3-phosphate dehydrogenase